MGKIALQSKFCLLQCVTFNFDLIFFFVFFSLFLLNSQRTTYDSLRIRIYHLIQYFQAEFAKFHYLCFFDFIKSLCQFT